MNRAVTNMLVIKRPNKEKNSKMSTESDFGKVPSGAGHQDRTTYLRVTHLHSTPYFSSQSFFDRFSGKRETKDKIGLNF